MRAFARIIFALLLWVLLSGCDKTGGSKTQSRLESAVSSGAASFDFSADPAFTWNRMYVFDCYSSQSTVETALGFKWPDFRKTSIETSDSVALVVFVKQASVVYWYEQPRSIELCGLANGRGYARTEAKFSIVRTGGKPELQAAAQPYGHKRDTPA